MITKELEKAMQGLDADVTTIQFEISKLSDDAINLKTKNEELEKENNNLKKKLKIVEVLRAQIDQLLAEDQ